MIVYEPVPIVLILMLHIYNKPEFLVQDQFETSMIMKL